MVEHRPFKPLAPGSSPGAPTNIAWIAQSVEQWIEDPRVGGSIPPPRTIYHMPR